MGSRRTLTSDFSAWCADNGLIVVALVLALAVWSGRKVLQGNLLQLRIGDRLPDTPSRDERGQVDARHIDDLDVDRRQIRTPLPAAEVGRSDCGKLAVTIPGTVN